MAEHFDPNPADSLSASSESAHRSKQALLIGVSQYVEGWQPLPAAKSDVEALQSLLLDSDLGKFETARMLLNPERQQIEEEVRILADVPADLLLLYFSGCGFLDQGVLYLETTIARKDTQGTPIKPMAVSLLAIRDILDRNPMQQQVVILDCCFDAERQSTDAIDIQSQLQGGNRAILVAANSIAYTSAQKQGDVSLYTRHLLEAMRVGTADRSKSEVTVSDLHHYVSRRVEAEAPAIQPQLYLPRSNLDIVLTSAPPLDDKLNYRREVEQRSQGGQAELSNFDRLLLNWRRDRLGLSPDTTADIEQAVVRPYGERQQKLHHYEQTLIKVASYQYPFSAATQRGLEQLRQRLGLLPDQTEAIAAPVLAPLESRYQENLRQYEQHFALALEAHYPPDREMQNELRYLEQQLHLRLEDVAATKRQVVARYQEHHAEPLQAVRSDGESSSTPRSDDYLQKLQQYGQIFFDRLQPRQPFHESDLKELVTLQQSLQLTDADVLRTEEEATHQKLSGYEQNLQNYQQDFSRLVESGAIDQPITRDRLRQLQHQHALADADAAQVEKIVFALVRPSEIPGNSETARVIAEPTPIDPLLGDTDASPDQESSDTLTREGTVDSLPADLLSDSVRSARLDDSLPVTAQPSESFSEGLAPADLPVLSEEVFSDARPLRERLRDRQYLVSVALQTLKAIGLAVFAVLGGRLLITAILSLLPGRFGQIAGIVVFLLSLLLAWQLMNL